MNWLLHNVVADLYGPYFLLFYGTVIVVLIVACFRSIRAVDRTRDLEPPEIPAKLDPYEVAYLRGGENEVTRVAIASMIQRGLLRIVEEKKWLTTSKKIDRGREPGRRELAPIEAIVWKWSGFPADPQAIFQSSGIPRVIAKACSHYEADLAERGLAGAPGDEATGAAALVLRAGHDHPPGPVQAWRRHREGAHQRGLPVRDGDRRWACVLGRLLALPRLSHQGKAYLERLKLAYGGLRSRIRGGRSWTVTWAGIRRLRSRK